MKVALGGNITLFATACTPKVALRRNGRRREDAPMAEEGTRYAKAPDGVHIAYQASGVGRHDILFVPGQITHLEVQWEDPEFARWLRRLSGSGRLIQIDRRGVGLSDRLSPDDLPPAEVLAEDLSIVMDAAGVVRPVLFGFAEGAQIASLFAALHPERVEALILYAMWPYATDAMREDYDRYLELAERRWGSLELGVIDTREVEPSRADDPAYVAWVAKIQRTALSPGAVRPLFETSLSLDVRNVLPTITVPTLVMHRERDSSVGADILQTGAAMIPNANYVVLPGGDHWVTAEPQDPMFDAIDAFLGGLDGQHTTSTRRLATVLFTDIVGSTDHAAALGDSAWKDALQRHHAVVRAALQQHGGREISTAGDGFFAAFDGPAAACRCALEIMAELSPTDLEIRAGVHTGEVETIDGEIGGMGVTIGARIGAQAGASELLVSSTVKDLSAGSGLTFADAGEHALKGVPDPWHLYRVVG
jgi:class 3 adenylate cyclase/pimeloyl-ACP methyl ester carboxylesterase